MSFYHGDSGVANHHHGFSLGYPDQAVMSVPMMANLSCINDDTLGPIVHGCRDDFDFTIKFEQVFLSIVPSALFLTHALARSQHLLGRKKIATGPKFMWLKLLVIAVYTGIRLRQLVLTSYGTSWTSQTAIAADTLGFVAGLALLPLSFLEHARSRRPSILIGIYLLVTLLLDVAQARTLWLLSESAYDEQQARLAVVAAAVKAAILVLESLRKPQASFLDQKEQSPEVTSGMFQLATFSWLNGLFSKGYRKILAINDLYLLDDAMSAEVLYAQFEPRMARHVSLGHKNALFRSLVSTLAIPLLLPAIPRLFRIGFTFCQPFLIESLLNYLQQPVDSSSPNKGYGYIGAAVFIYLGMAVTNSAYYYLHERFMYMVRGILCSALYRRTTNLKLSATDDAASLTLMNTDTERIRGGISNIHELWSNLVEIIIACWLLYRQIGAAFVAPIVLVAVCAASSTSTAGITGRRNGAWMNMLQQQVAVTSKTIATMKAIKISALSGPVEDLMLALRHKEIKTGGKWRMMLVVSVAISFIPSSLGPVVAFATTSETLGVTRIFTAMAYLLLLNGPLGMLFQSFPILVSAWACLGRVQTYLDKEHRVEFRKTPEPGREPAKQNGHATSETKATAIAVKGGSFGWEKDKMILNNIDVEIPASSLTIIVGPVASGKSTLLKALLGETSFNSGEVVFGVSSRRIGYCDQSPFLYNDTVKANIIGHSSYDRQRYDQVIDATMLSYDLSTLPKGDRTKVGSSGVTLSGGQKQRVALARALYMDTGLLIFDDILSGLDANTEAHVFRKVFGSGGIVRRRGVTAVLCTHSIRHLPTAEHIIALGKDCEIVEQGTFADLKSNGKYIESLKIQEAKQSSAVEDDGTAEEVPLARTVTEVPDEKEEEHDKSRQVGDIAVYKHYFATISTWTLVAFVFWCIMDGVTGASSSIWLKYWSEDITAPHPTHPQAFWLGIYFLLRFGLVTSLIMAVFICFRTIIYQSGTALHKQALRTLIDAPLRFFTVTDAGVTINLFAQDVTLLDTELPMSGINLTVNFFASLGTAAVIVTSSPWLAIFYPFVIVILFTIQTFYLRTSRQLRLLDLEAKSPLFSHFIDTLKGLATIRAAGFISADIALNNNLLDNSQRPAYQLALIQRWLAFTLRILVSVIAILVVTLATQLRSNSGFTGASLISVMYFSDALATVVQAYTHVESSIGAVARIKTFQAKVLPESGPEETVIPGPSWPERGHIEIKSVSASYAITKHSPPSTEPPSLALQDLNLTIRAGTRVAVCGRTGSGKSSLILLLLRLLEPLPTAAGDVLIDNRSLLAMNRTALRRLVIAVSQDPVFLPDASTVRANLDPFGEATEETCLDALKRVHLDRAVLEKGGLDAPLAADSFSAGQKQLFCLARAVVRARVKRASGHGGHGGGVLLLDEVSSSVDRATELEMHEVIKEEFEGYTVVMVSHRLDTVEDCDGVVVMDKGRVAEEGEPGLLKTKEGGLFRELWERSRQADE
ncbi:ABC transporter FUM19 [Colletotrichum sidae]|uniref:ABC transporter FUM19 n=1 Tax=Colletotrichum sidae TaxID=1347389 RepID=A0A4R8TR97_9PEZI|nr:ABC transporter FUM19 [Colletotrichum sidae]